MISSSMDEILRRFNDRKGCLVNQYEDTEAVIVGCEESHAVKGRSTRDHQLLNRLLNYQFSGFQDLRGYCGLHLLPGKERKKFNEHDDQIKPTFSIGLYAVSHKTWFHQLIDAETSLSGSVARFGKVKFRATTMDYWFQNKIKDIFPTFQKDPQVLLSESSLIKAATGHLISLSTSWAYVDYVFMPLLPTNKAHWMLGLVEFRSHTLMLFNSAGKTYRDWKVLEGIESYVKVLPALMKPLEISKKDPDYNESECKQMKVTIDSSLPQ
ncbi:sentrin-specific protease 1-like [Olea europaea subsp. europaea]|uniref:Sentrin-specific protease 1-like n=1 Tax=Olea europaea subsp. europaea TaxID=158383 RepID=A0A8S0SKK5_OLEEU|nr:sentrin-specific protease 1-like [Olea europaea subsp. europaea]